MIESSVKLWALNLGYDLMDLKRKIWKITQM